MYSGQSIVYIFFHVLLELSMNFLVQPGSLPGVVWSLLQILHFSTILHKRLWTSFYVSFLPLIQCWNIFDVYGESCPFTFFLFFSHSSTLNIGGKGIEKSLLTFCPRLSEVILDLEILWRKHFWLENCFCVHPSANNSAPYY